MLFSKMPFSFQNFTVSFSRSTKFIFVSTFLYIHSPPVILVKLIHCQRQSISLTVCSLNEVHCVRQNHCLHKPIFYLSMTDTVKSMEKSLKKRTKARKKTTVFVGVLSFFCSFNPRFRPFYAPVQHSFIFRPDQDPQKIPLPPHHLPAAAHL